MLDFGDTKRTWNYKLLSDPKYSFYIYDDVTFLSLDSDMQCRQTARVEIGLCVTFCLLLSSIFFSFVSFSVLCFMISRHFVRVFNPRHFPRMRNKDGQNKKKKTVRVQQLINLEIPVLVWSLKSRDFELG